MEEEIKCKRCGKCCHYYNFDIEEWVPCRFLRYDGEDKTRCAIYRFRIGMPMNRKQPFIRCGYRKDSFNFKDCPYNVLDPKKEIVF